MANNIIKRTWKQGGMVGIEDLRGLTFQNEALAHTFKISGVDADGSAIALTGTPAGVMLRADNMDVALTCALSDGCVTASLPAECYDVPGRAEITIYLTEDGHKVCIYAAIVSVNRTSSGTASPGTAADVVDLVNMMQTSVDAAADSATAAAGSATSAAASAETASAAYNVNLLAPNFVQENPYPAGQHVIYDGGYYVLPNGHEADVTWENTSKTQLTVGGEAADLKSALKSNILTIGDDLSEFKSLTFITKTGFYRGTDGSLDGNTGWYAKVYTKTQADVIKINGSKFNSSAPMVVFYSGEPSTSTFIGYKNPDWYSGTSIATSNNEIIQIPHNAQYFAVNSQNGVGTVTGYTYGNKIYDALDDLNGDLQGTNNNMTVIHDDLWETIENISEYRGITHQTVTGFYRRSDGSLDGNTGWYARKYTRSQADVVKINGTQYNGSAPMILFYNGEPSSSTYIGYYNPDDYTGDALQTSDNEVVIIPDNASYFVVNSPNGVGTIVGYIYGNKLDVINEYKVIKATNEITVKTKAGVEYGFKPIGANGLWQLYKWIIGEHTYSHGTDIFAPYYDLRAVNNADGDRTSQEPWTGGGHDYDGTGTSSATASSVSVVLYIDNVPVSDNGEYDCGSVSIVITNNIQGTNTCKQDGSGRSILQEKITCNIKQNTVDVNNVITPLEDVILSLYYGMQLPCYHTENYEALADTLVSISGWINFRPIMIMGYDSYGMASMQMYDNGIGNYSENYDPDKKAIVSYNKAYFCPIKNNTNVWAQGIHKYYTGRYIFGRTIDY